MPAVGTMDPYKILGLTANQIQHPSDLDKARRKAKQLYKRCLGEKKKFDAKKVLEAYDQIKLRLKGRPGEGANKILGRSRKERELDKHFNHQTKEIKKNKDVKRILRKASKGEERFLLPGQKERLPTQRRHRRHHRGRRRRHSGGHGHGRSKRAKQNIDSLEGLRRVVPFLSQQQKFPKAVKLLNKWVHDYMNSYNREQIFEVLHALISHDFIVEDPEARQEVIATFEYALRFYAEWFEGEPKKSLLGTAWRVATILACQCFTDDAFTLSATIGKLGEVLTLLEKHKDDLPEAKKEEAKEEVKDEDEKDEALKGENEKAKFEEAVKAKLELMENKKGSSKMARPFRGMAAPVEPAPAAPVVAGPAPKGEDAKEEEVEAVALDSGSEDAGPCEIKSDSDDDVKEELVDIDSEEEEIDEEEISSGGSSIGDEIELSSECESSGSVEELEGSIWPTPSIPASLEQIRVHFVFRCLGTLFQHRGPLWARPKIDAFFQDIFYRRAIFAEQQVSQIEAWQARIKVLQKIPDRAVGEANNPLEANRPVVDSRETLTIMEANGDAWAGKQTFDRRDAFGGSKTLR